MFNSIKKQNRETLLENNKNVEAKSYQNRADLIEKRESIKRRRT